MAKFYFDQDADLTLLQGKTVGIIGYGNQGRAQALNLRDSGVNVIVGSPSDSSGQRARDDGFDVFAIDASVHEADILFLLLPDEFVPKIYHEEIAGHLRANMLLNFAHGYNITYKNIVPRGDLDITMIAPRMIGKGVRDTFQRGEGFPSLVAVYQNASGKAHDLMLALSKGIGTTRMGAIESSFEEETQVDLFSEQSGDFYMLQVMFEALVEAGFDPDVILLEMYASGELGEMYHAAQEMGLMGQLRLHSRTSQYGQTVTANRFFDRKGAKEHFRKVIEHIKSGKFAAEWKAEEERNFAELNSMMKQNLEHPMQISENHLYRKLRRRDKDLVEADWLKVQ